MKERIFSVKITTTYKVTHHFRFLMKRKVGYGLCGEL
jgi:hypothetical protein